MFKDSLFRNSFFLMMTSAVISSFGFLFWLLAAHRFSPEMIGVATSLISAATLASSFSMLGFNNVLVRFLPSSEHQDEHISTAFVLTGLASLLSSLIFLIWIRPEWYIGLVFVGFTLFTSLNAVIENIFVAHRKTEFILFKNFLLSVSRLFFVLFSVGVLGILGATAGATFLACVLGYWWLVKRFGHSLNFRADKKILKEVKEFAIGNYFGTLLGVVPNMALVLIVALKLGTRAAAFYYIPSLIVTFLSVIPTAVSQSLFAETSHDGKIEEHFKASLKHMFSLLIPSALLIILSGRYILGFFGTGYTEGFAPLVILVLAGVINSANTLGDTLLNIKKKAGMYLFMNLLNAVVVIVPAYVFSWSLTSIGWSVLGGQMFTAMVYLVMNWELVSFAAKN